MSVQAGMPSSNPSRASPRSSVIRGPSTMSRTAWPAGFLGYRKRGRPGPGRTAPQQDFQQVRRPRAHRPGRRAFVSGKKKQNTIISDHQGRTLWNGADRPGRMHDQTAVGTEGIAEQLRLHLKVKAEVDEGYRGLANEFPGQVTAPPKKPKDDAPEGDKRAWREMRRRQSSRRIVVEHANAEMRQWRPLQRYTGAAKIAPRHTAPSREWSPTAPPSGPPSPPTAPNWCSPDRAPADQPPAEPPGEQVPASIADPVVTGSGRRSGLRC
ncbi:transposase family protein [Streptomyces sp. NPDC001970]